ncbi:hypothetical protein [Paenibacillus amylolyticus]|uniref:hypothetical protein n=1 Tax=Paenibacillus amylolyticus TaxID=1451 RepID=UPI003EB6BFF8
MKYLRSGFTDTSVKNLNVLLYNNLHIGSEAVDIRLLDRAIDFDKTNEDNFCILLNGDPIKRFANDPYKELVREVKRWLLTLSGKKSNKGTDVKWIR